jgi:HEAT repeat protein
VRFAVTVIVLALAAAAEAQPPQAAVAADPTAAALGRGWSALGQGQPAKAVEVARQLLQSDPGNHEAAALAAAAYSADRRSIAALDTYERWLQASVSEDVFILRTIAGGVLRALAASPEPRIRIAALSALAEAGDRTAREALTAAAQPGGAAHETDAALAKLGDRDAIARLEAAITAGGPRDKSAAIGALSAAGSSASAPAIAAALKDPAPPSRMAAARALADLGATNAIPALTAALQEQDPAVRHMIAVSLARLGDPSGGVTLQSLEQSPVGEFRLIAAAAAAAAAPNGPWDSAAEALLEDPDPLVRLRAAALLLEHDRSTGKANAVLAAGIGDASPAVRTAASNLVIDAIRKPGVPLDLPALRRMLRDRLPEIQAAAAGSLLRLPQR